MEQYSHGLYLPNVHQVFILILCVLVSKDLRSEMAVFDSYLLTLSSLLNTYLLLQEMLMRVHQQVNNLQNKLLFCKYAVAYVQIKFK